MARGPWRDDGSGAALLEGQPPAATTAAEGAQQLADNDVDPEQRGGLLAPCRRPRRLIALAAPGHSIASFGVDPVADVGPRPRPEVQWFATKVCFYAQPTFLALPSFSGLRLHARGVNCPAHH